MAAERHCPTLFVTGTDTGVGKTLVTAALARQFAGRGLKVGVMKPVETGVRDPALLGEDAELLCRSAGSRDPVELVSPYRFAPPVAPAQAASAAGTPIDIDVIVAAAQSLRHDKDILLIEGAGGLMVPLRGGFLMADLAKALGTPLLVVTHPRLGTLNHTLLTTFAARAMGLALSGLVINRMPDHPGDAEREAPHLLASLASADLIGVLPELNGTPDQMVARLAEEVAAMPGYRWFMHGLGLF